MQTHVRAWSQQHCSQQLKGSNSPRLAMDAWIQTVGYPARGTLSDLKSQHILAPAAPGMNLET